MIWAHLLTLSTFQLVQVFKTTALAACSETLPCGERGWGRGNAIRQVLVRAGGAADNTACLIGLPEGEGRAFSLLRSGVWLCQTPSQYGQDRARSD